jgi:hypothetical protein
MLARRTSRRKRTSTMSAVTFGPSLPILGLMWQDDNKRKWWPSSPRPASPKFKDWKFEAVTVAFGDFKRKPDVVSKWVVPLGTRLQHRPK